MSTPFRITGYAIFLLGWLLNIGGLPSQGNSSTTKAGLLKNKAVIEECEKLLDSPSLLLRRQAARKLAEAGIEARSALEKALENADCLVQRTALRALCHLSEVDSLPYLKTAITSSDAFVRLAAVEELSQIQPRTDEVTKLLRIARKDPSQEVSTIANKALWPFHRQNQSIRDRLDYDHEVQIFQEIPLPKDGWKFCLDPQQEGHLKKWYVRDFDDSRWKEIGIESAWQEFGYDYIGVAWYRCWISLPSRPEHLAVDLQFDGVDENAWVWVNGVYVGSHAIGPAGWDQPFYLDVTKEIRWGMKNQITVRAMNTINAGGIWRPVRFEVLR